MGDLERLTPEEVTAVVARLQELAERARAYGDQMLWMVLFSAADSIADGLDMQQDVWADD